MSGDANLTPNIPEEVQPQADTLSETGHFDKKRKGIDLLHDTMSVLRLGRQARSVERLVRLQQNQTFGIQGEDEPDEDMNVNVGDQSNIHYHLTSGNTQTAGTSWKAIAGWIVGAAMTAASLGGAAWTIYQNWPEPDRGHVLRIGPDPDPPPTPQFEDTDTDTQYKLQFRD